MLSVEALRLVKQAAFIILSTPSSSGSDVSDPATSPRSQYIGVGVFVTAITAVTVAHNLNGADTVMVYFPESRERVKLDVVRRNEEYDYAVLRCTEHRPHLQLYTGPNADLVGEGLAMCAFQIGILEELPEFSTSMGVMPANGVKLSKHGHHLVYASSTWPGDSGAALVMYDGRLVGLHVAGVNSLQEKFDRMHSMEARLTAVEDSLESAARSVATGCVALLASVFTPDVV